MLYIGIDLGTSAVKLLLMDENGKIKNIVSKEYPLYFPKPGWSEQKPEDWYIAIDNNGVLEELILPSKDPRTYDEFNHIKEELFMADKKKKLL